jgi:folate-binding protein YgfZ
VTCHNTNLDHEALLHITGPDALSFLQGQLSCDTRTLSPERALPGVYCTVQGRVICDFLLCQLADAHFGLRMRREIRGAAAALLGKYIVFSKAELDDKREDWQLLACWGASAATTLHGIFGAAPQARYEARSGPGFALLQLDEQGEQFECYLDAMTRPELLAQLQAGTQPGPTASWQALQIASGVARIEAATSGEFIPQVLNYDITGHISFNKGCYTGQEVVARMHYKGKPKRRLYPATIASGDSALPASGEPLYLAGTERPAGHLINCAEPAGDLLVALVTSTREGIASGLRLAGATGAEVITGLPPYPLPELEPDNISGK